MWWLDPGKEVLNVLFNRILAPYVENLDMGQVNYGIGQGQLTLRNLRLKKGALDKFRLPVDVLEGHLGTFTLALHWMNLGNQPVQITIEDVYLLVVPSPQANTDSNEEERRAQAAKAERLENAELLHMRGQAETTGGDSQQTQGLLASLTAKIINNLQVTVKNIHIRYEDKLSVPGHPFAAGVTLAGFTAVSVNEKWEAAFIESTAGAIHKLATLQSLAVYFDTDSPSLAGLPAGEAIKKFNSLISHGKKGDADHQFILKPVSGEGRVIMNHKIDKHTPRFDVQLLFDEIGITLDDNQYRDAISLVDMYHVYVRQHQYRKFRPLEVEFKTNKAKSLLQFAGNAILQGVHERHRKWTWEYFAERRDDRNAYIRLFQKKEIGPPLAGEDYREFQALETKLSYEDIRFYRSIARSRLRKDLAAQKQIAAEKQKEKPQAKGWGGWLWGTGKTDQPHEDPVFGGPMTEEQRKQLYEALDYDEKHSLAESFEAPGDALKARVAAKLNKGSLSLKTDPHGATREVISIVFDVFTANLIQRTDNLEAAISLGDFGVFDGTTQGSLYPKIVQVKESTSRITKGDDISSQMQSEAAEPSLFATVENAAAPADPFFFVKFENNPLDGRADNALTVRMRHMEIIYHRGYVEAVYAFFKPPASQLESVEALLNVASETLEGLRKETRAGLEYALQTHKTVDIQMDMNAPIIIIPENVTTHNCKHLIVDAGHISIESDLADKDAIREIHSKRNQKYSDADYKRLESLMYDKVSLRLKDAQFLVGNDLQSCRDALAMRSNNALHLLERISMDFQVHISIVPSALNLARFKVSGKLPQLQVNLSDTKYKSLMRLIDVCIPNFDGDSENTIKPPPLKHNPSSSGYQLSSGLFGPNEKEYHVEDNESESGSDSDDEDPAENDDEFFEAEDGNSDRPELRQHIFELSFQVDNLKASLSKTGADRTDRLLGDVSLQRFGLEFALAKYDMKVDIALRSLSMNLVQVGADPIKFMSSADETGLSEDTDLLSIAYTRAQKESPEFMSKFEGINQSVDIKISTFIFRAAPEPVVALYDFIMTTFVPKPDPASGQQPSSKMLEPSPQEVAFQSAPSNDKIRVLVKLASVQVILVGDEANLATLSMSTADISILLRANTMRIGGRLGSLALSDDSDAHGIQPEFKQIMSIEGKNFAEFRYQTFDPSDEAYTGGKSSVYLNAGSIKVHFLEGPLHDIYKFLIRLARLKGLYDAATQAAAQSAPEIERMQFDISVNSPIMVFPTDPKNSKDVLIMRLGEIKAKNTSEQVVNKISASLRGIQFTSTAYHNGTPSVLKIIDDIDITADIVQTAGIDRTQDSDYPDTQVAVKISDVKLHLAEFQYVLLIGVMKAVPRVLSIPEDDMISDSVPSTVPTTPISSTPISTTPPPGTSAVDLEPELRMVDGSRNWTSVDLIVSINVVKLHLYDRFATEEASLKDHGIARFALNNSTLRLKLLCDGSGEAQVVLKSFTMSNTRAGNSRFREIIPAAAHERNQFMLFYTFRPNSGLAILTVDSPHVIFTIDPVFALLEFFTSAFLPTPPTEAPNAFDQSEAAATSNSTMDFRLDLHDVSISVLEDDSDPESRALRLSINQILLSQQGIMALTVNRLGMSLISMGKSDDSVRFLDDVDLTVSIDSRTSSSQQMTSIEMTANPIVFRASYRDINLITTIVNKAIAMYGSTQTPGSGTVTQSASAPSIPATKSLTTKGRSRQPSGKARVLISKEQMKGSFEGFRLILIGDMHEQPMIHLKVKPFIVGAKDWTGELQATTTIATSISYWNLSNSHWEPLIDPWTFTFGTSKDGPSGGMNVTLSARERLDVNLSTTFVELAVTTMNMWGKEGAQVLSKARGSYAPYRIRNRTGSPIFIWSDVDGSSNTASKDVAAVKIGNEETVDWRFEDWKTMREHLASSGQHNIGIQFVGKQWEQLRSVPVDRAGEFTFSLRPRTEKFANRLLCEVKVVDNVKIVTIRSTYNVENLTLYPLELTLVDDSGRPVYSLEKIAPGQDYPLPIEAVTSTRIRLQPDQGFGYKWCPPIRWEDLIAKKSFTIKCPHADPAEGAFRFQSWVETDLSDPIARKYPKINLKLRAPLEIENLLPYDLRYRVYDKDLDQNWRSYLRQGGIMPVHSVELAHLLLLNIEVQDTIFKPSDFAIINTDGHSDFEIESRVTLRDATDRKLDLRLNYVRHPNSGGAFRVQIYSPYLVVNKTGLPFYIKSTRSTRATPPQDVAGETRVEILTQPTPFMLSHPHDRGHEFLFRLRDANWSKARLMSLEAPAAETALVMPSQKNRSEELHIGLSWTEGLGKYKLTKVITLAPRFLVKNNLNMPIGFREHGAAPQDRSVVEPSERCPLFFTRSGDDKLLTIALPGLDAQWSAPVSIQDIGSNYVRLLSGSNQGSARLIRVDVQIDGPTIFVFLSEAESWPYIIENDSDYTVTLMQTDGDETQRPKYTLKPRSSLDYAWDSPAAREKKITLLVAGARRVVDIKEIGALVPFKFHDEERRSKAVSLDVRADGPQQILRITKYTAENSVYKPKHRAATTISRQDSMVSSSDAFEAVTEEIPPSFTFNVDFAGIGLSLVNRQIVEVLYITLSALKLEYSDSAVAQTVNLSLGTIQIDNQLHDAIFPVLLQPTPLLEKTDEVAALPTVQSSAIWLKDQAHGVLFIKYFSILVQALTIEADEDLLYSIYDLTQIKGVSWDTDSEDVLLPHPQEIPEPHATAVGQDVYFEVMELQPIRLALSFVRTERVSGDDTEKLSIRNPLAVVVNALTMTLGNVNNAPLEMNALAIKDMRLTLPELQNRVMYHYRQDVLRQLYRILGSADFIGNPVGLFSNVSSGISDIFYEPFNGVVMHGNKELGIGIAKGAASFVKKTVFGVSDSMTKITSSVGKGLSAATFDSEYQARRRMTQRRNRPRHAIYGVTAGGEALASSVASAMEGVLMKPIEGAELEGAFGFFKGIGKGLVGAVTKPVVGVFDLASNVAEGVRNTTTVFDDPERGRVRLPRHVPSDSVLRPFSDREALGQYWMRDLNNGAYRKERYVAHINTPGADNVILLTASRVLSIWTKKLKLDWELPFNAVSGVTVEDQGIRFSHKGGKEHDKFCYITDKSSQSWFFQAIARVVAQHNVRRRMDA